jgi:hypothetical protein
MLIKIGFLTYENDIYKKCRTFTKCGKEKIYFYLKGSVIFLIQEELYTKNSFKSIFLVIMESFILFQPKI